MGCFSGKFSITPINERWSEVDSSYEFLSCTLRRCITIPAGFKTDGATVPWFVWLLIPPWSDYGPAVVVHDYLYRWQRCTRREADDALLEGLSFCRSSWWRLILIYTFVRLCGWHGWNKDKKHPLSLPELEVNMNPRPCPWACVHHV